MGADNLLQKVSMLNQEILVLIGGQILPSLRTAFAKFALPWLLLQVAGSALQRLRHRNDSVSVAEHSSRSLGGSLQQKETDDAVGWRR
jgi:hypothetical protein